MLNGIAAFFVRNQRILVKLARYIKPESAASKDSFSYSAAVFSIPLFARTSAALGLIAGAACVGAPPQPDPPGMSRPDASQVFYTVTAEIALSRHEPRVAALEYAAAAEHTNDPGLLRRATEVAAQCLQPALTVDLASRWIVADSSAVDAHRAAGKAALALHHIEQSAAQYHMVLTSSPRGSDAEFAALETELAVADNVYGARQLADRLAAFYPASAPALRVQAFSALRADDPAAAARTFAAALAATDTGDAAQAARRDLTQGWRRARVLAGDTVEPLAQARAELDRETNAQNRLDYALVLLAAQQNAAARSQLTVLTADPQAKPAALRLLGLIDFQEGKLDDASTRFAELVTTGKFLEEAIYYLALIAERHDDFERALRLYAEVQEGENTVPALLRAAAILRAHGAAPAAAELLDQLAAEEPERAPEVLAARARMEADAGDAAQAMVVLKEAELQYPDSVELRYALASLSADRGQTAAALRVLKEVAALRPGDPAALNAYGYTLADGNRQLGTARKLIERAHAAAPKNAAILDSLGWVLYRQGHGDEALRYLDAAYADDRGNDIAAHLGEVLWRLGRQTDAEKVWAEARRANGDNSLLKATRLRLHAAD